MIGVVGYLAILFRLYTHKPCTFIIIWGIPYTALIISDSDRKSDKITNALIVWCSLSLGAFLFSTIKDHKVFIIIFLFILIYLIYSRPKMKILINILFFFPIFLLLPIGWHNGINRIYEVTLTVILGFMLSLVFEWLFMKYIMRKSLRYTNDVFNDMLLLYMDLNNNEFTIRKLSIKYLLTLSFYIELT